MEETTEIFVFGSNHAGRYGAGAALAAVRQYGAEDGVGEGLTGNSYALPTMDHRIETLPLDAIQAHVDTFLDVARRRPDLRFIVTAIGCGIAGYKPREIAPMFEPALAMENVYLPAQFCDVLDTATRVSFDRGGRKVAAL